MEHVAPPEPEDIPGMPQKATTADHLKLLERAGKRRLFGILSPRPSIELAAGKFHEGCLGGGRYANNCAHFLSNAFVLAGYSELLTDSRHIRAWCGPTECHPPRREGRPIRAREMRAWFKSKGGSSYRFFPRNSQAEFERTMRNTGFWAVFELDESQYWGGHVCILDTDDWKVYGTGMNGYWTWEQHCYRW
jgi:hypothetical protein